MKTIKSVILSMITFVILGSVITSCKPEVVTPDVSTENTFTSLESPYLICANRNPGGIGFDFLYNGVEGGANNLDSLSVSDFNYDLKIRTIKGEKPDGSLSGAPFIQLSSTTQAVNYSAIDTSCKGITGFTNLNASNIQAYTLASDDISFNTSSLTAGTTGSPLMQELVVEFNKLVIGQYWKETAYNTISEDEIIWIVETDDGAIIKFIVLDFPAFPAPSSTGYIAIEWGFVE